MSLNILNYKFPHKFPHLCIIDAHVEEEGRETHELLAEVPAERRDYLRQGNQHAPGQREALVLRDEPRSQAEDLNERRDVITG